MSYCTLGHVTNILGQGLTSSKPNVSTKVPLWNIGNTLDADITPELIYEYIRWAQDEIDSEMTFLYRTPLKKTAQGEWNLEQDINEYNPTNVVITDATSLVPGDEILIISDAFNPPLKEKHFVATIVDSDEFTTVDPILTNFPADETRVVRIGFPPAVTLVCARKAAANIYDKYFAAQASPDMSEYGNTLRNKAMEQMTDILNGIVILHGQDRLGNRFANSTLYDRFQILSRDNNDNRELKKNG